MMRTWLACGNPSCRRPRHRCTRLTPRAIDESGILDVVGNVLGRKFQPEAAVLASAFFALLSVVVNIFGGLITERKRADLVLEVGATTAFGVGLLNLAAFGCKKCCRAFMLGSHGDLCAQHIHANTHSSSATSSCSDSKPRCRASLRGTEGPFWNLPSTWNSACGTWPPTSALIRGMCWCTRCAALRLLCAVGCCFICVIGCCFICVIGCCFICATSAVALCVSPAVALCV